MTLIRRNNHPGFSPLWSNFFNGDLFDFDREVFTQPAVNVKENEDGFELEVAAPGLDKNDFKIELNNKILTLSTQKEIEKEEKDEARKYTRKEFAYQSFKRTFTLPDTVEGDKIEARYDNGVLFVSIPKKEEAKVKGPKLIEVG